MYLIITIKEEERDRSLSEVPYFGCARNGFKKSLFEVSEF